jgi:hypothetical protein
LHLLLKRTDLLAQLSILAGMSLPLFEDPALDAPLRDHPTRYGIDQIAGPAVVGVLDLYVAVVSPWNTLLSSRSLSASW